MRQLGLDVIWPDQYTAMQQLELFASASLVVGPSGAGMFNALLCRPETVLLNIESEPDWLWGHANLFSSARLRYGMHIARRNESYAAPHRPYTIAIDALASSVHQLISELRA